MAAKFLLACYGVLAYASTIDRQVLELTSFKPSVDATPMTVPR